MGKKVRLLTVFVVCAVVLQLLCLLFLTPEGIEHLFPLRVRLAAEKIKPESNTYAAYYDMRSDITDADVIVIGVDYNADETYAMLGHFTRFVKQYNNISDVALDLDALQTSIVGLLFKHTDEAVQQSSRQACRRRRNECGLQLVYVGVVLCQLNNAPEPQVQRSFIQCRGFRL